MLNKIILQGRVANDLAVETVGSGTKICRFSLAVQRSAKSKSGSRETDFIPCSVFGNSADFMCKYFKKGSMALVTGSLQMSQYEKNGQKMTYASVLVDSIDFCGGSKEGDSAPAETQSVAPDISTAQATDSEVQLPFEF